jgi:hypothetical protein
MTFYLKNFDRIPAKILKSVLGLDVETTQNREACLLIQ